MISAVKNIFTKWWSFSCFMGYLINTAPSSNLFKLKHFLQNWDRNMLTFQ